METTHPTNPNHQPVQLSAVFDRFFPPAEPEFGRVVNGPALFYPGESHILAGPPGSGKSFYALAVAAETAMAGRPVLILDFENSLRATLSRLQDLGLTEEAAARVFYQRLDGPLQGETTRAVTRFLIASLPALVIVDGVARAMALGGLDENSNQNVHTYFSRSILPLQQDGGAAAVVLIDHQAKPGRDGFPAPAGARGAGAKIDAVSGAAYSFRADIPFTRTTNGRATLIVVKDRHGCRPAGSVAARIEVTVDHSGFVAFAAEAENGTASAGRSVRDFRQEVIAAVKASEEPVSRAGLYRAVQGRERLIQEAVETLLAEGVLTEGPGSRGARLVTMASASVPC